MGLFLIFYSDDRGSQSSEFRKKFLISPLDVVDFGYFRYSICHQAGKNQRSTGPKVRSQHLGSPKGFFSFDDSTSAFYLNIGTHSIQFTDMHIPVFKNCFHHGAGPFDRSQQSHELGLHIRGKSRIGKGFYIRGDQRVYIPLDQDAFIIIFYYNTTFPKLGDDRLYMIRNRIVDQVYPGAAARVFETLDEIDLPDDYFKPTERTAPIKAAAPAAKSRAKAKAVETPVQEADDLDDDGIKDMPSVMG